MAVAAALAHKFRLNKAVALAASNVSFGPLAPVVMAAGLITGHFLRTGSMMAFTFGAGLRRLPAYAGEWAIGSVVLGLVVGAVGTGLTYLLARALARAKPIASHD